MATTTSKERNRERRNRRVKNVKTGGDLVMYIGSTALMIPAIQKARQNNNFLMSTCAIGAGAIISMGLGKIASGIFNKTVDKVVDFCDDVKPADKESIENDEEKDEENE